MATGDWRKRLFASTRGRVVTLLRRSAQTVNDLARKLELTDNAVRLHLSALERDGLIEPHGTQREWTGKPATIYRTTMEAETLFPKPYDVVLGELLTVLEERHSPQEMEQMVREVGARLGRAVRMESGDLHARAAHAARVLTELGGLAEVEVDEDTLRIQGYSCPLGKLTPDHPRTCQLAEALVSELVGKPVVECCDRGERPRCAFRLAHST